MKKCKTHKFYSGKTPPKTDCPDCAALWDCSPHRKINVKRCLCLQCGKRINKPVKNLYNYCYITKDSCPDKDCFDCLEFDNQVIECEALKGEE
jgi:hypothetical protein